MRQNTLQLGPLIINAELNSRGEMELKKEVSKTICSYYLYSSINTIIEILFFVISITCLKIINR